MSLKLDNNIIRFSTIEFSSSLNSNLEYEEDTYENSTHWAYTYLRKCYYFFIAPAEDKTI